MPGLRSQLHDLYRDVFNGAGFGDMPAIAGVCFGNIVVKCRWWIAVTGFEVVGGSLLIGVGTATKSQ